MPHPLPRMVAERMVSSHHPKLAVAHIGSRHSRELSRTSAKVARVTNHYMSTYNMATLDSVARVWGVAAVIVSKSLV
jgi:hypothetical protein